ncbi:hypothetical protein JCGZ_23954 [Jatropha curcas]|uniref:Alpha-taxilin n=1 Tax=Jatropha curcas TaxID=180498 RepID=A0A067JSH0_JATCU|nr:beta-taxilin [Jatropha curcas]XP_012086511.1 beta-taxilin [Jatropha curcas]XP_012086512.1 beta-taxilin [Jatropha curcas]KDP25733.1 hypothetical protein JCGZ_23954 [Jatropha curcas]
MENTDANQLPEVDSLPVGFVDGSNEPLAPPTPTLEQEKPRCDCNEDSISELDHSNERIPELTANESQTSLESNGKAEKLRPLPISMSEINGFDDSVKLVEVTDKADVEQAGDKIATLNSANLVSEASVGVSGCNELKEQVQGNCQSSERSTEGCSESVELQKGKKPETAEAKRKNAKRSFKSEKEFLEFSLKYQQVLTERDTAIAIRDKLESLCRELQRQNKMLMEECKRVSTEGQNLRLDLSAKFQDAIKDVSNKLDEQKEECFSQLKENEMLRNKLKQLADQYTLSEQQYAQKLKQKTLELQLADLKIKQHEEKLVQEQSQMKIYAEQVSQLLATEKNLRLQLTADGEKFQQFQDALLKSNEVFETFKQEIEKMAKSIKELKKENIFLKSKSEKSDVTLIELVEEREKLKKQLEKTRNQKKKLESLCRSLQAERRQNSTGSNTAEAVPTS